MPRLVRGTLKIPPTEDLATFQYKMLLKNYIYRAKISDNGSFEVLLRDLQDEDSLELLKKEFDVIEIREVINIEKLEI
ncbi:MAG: hypothetical protein DRN30_06450 [Thermoplasmata archaeon]|nr:hypothetical protein [Euryarchaeota archaeon]RLF63532.1 MAG: hypothetical protein DRN30_06450 [Thermoplasmata archaeon]